ncbi:Sensor protein ZraS [Aquisphaera giovannonii]|uniref:histidine kinase n=1 Tax=Aquisphaera giovannonii TaxID=406548 RepID=A0A5B9W2X7_9BACT|nr:GAF domain-containing protein [Aquisphaera giovannonii]QEH34599.1 Sensor protein ZraS [Aquisphaera giovannonii]
MGTLRNLIATPIDAAPEALRRQSIVLKLTLFVGLLVALTAGALISIGYVYTGRIFREQLRSRLSAVADDRRALLLTEIAHLEERIRTLASRYRLREALEHYLPGHGPPAGGASRGSPWSLDEVLDDTEGLLAFWIEDPDGRRLASSGPGELIGPFTGRRAPRGDAPDAADGPTLVGLPALVAGKSAALFRMAATTRSGEVVGSYMLVMDLAPVVAHIAAPRHLGETGEVLIGANAGGGDDIRYLFPPRLEPREVEFPRDRVPAMSRAVAGESGFMQTSDHGGRDVLASFEPVGYRGWGVVAKVNADEAYAPVRRLRRLLLGVGGLILALGLAASYAIARQHTRPIRKLAATADAIAGGDMQAASAIDVPPGDEVGTLAQAFRRMSQQISRSHADLERRIAARTRDLEAARDLLGALFEISTSRLDPRNIDKTFDSVLRSCRQLGYDLAMISLVDREAGVVRGVRGEGTMTGLVDLTVRPLGGSDILAEVVRSGRTVVIPDSCADPRCDQAAIALARFHGQIVLPLAGDEVMGTLQVATPEVLDPGRVDLRPLESLASHAARTLDALRHVEEIGRLNRDLEGQAAELKKSEAALREQTEILRSVLDCMREGVVVADRQGRPLVINPAAERRLGRGDHVGEGGRWRPLYDVYHPDRATPFATEDLPLYRAIRGEVIDLAELYIAHPSRRDGSWMLINARPLRGEGGEIRGGLVVFNDITRRKTGERRLAVQYAATRVLAESESLNEVSPAILEILGRDLDWDFGGFWRVDAGADRIRCSSTWRAPGADLSAFDGPTRAAAFARGEGLPGRVWESQRAAWIEDIAAEPAFPRASVAAAVGLRSAFAVPVSGRGDCLGVLEFFSRTPRARDDDLMEMATNLGRQIGQFIERQQIHSRMVQSEKLASLGMLSAGVAHEINNPLAYVANNLAVLERDMGSVLKLLALYDDAGEALAAHAPAVLEGVRRLDEECDFAYIRAHLEKILVSTRQGVKRVAEIVNNLRGFTRLDRAAVDQLDVHDALAAALEMIRGRLERRRIEVEEHLGDLPHIAASPVQINQVFLNLLVNAMQAVESARAEGGRIVLRTAALDGGDEVVIEIADNGCGIPPESLPHIFDPFFTTKKVGEGTGLGLSITHGIVQDHGGRIEVQSTPGEGTAFRIILPVARKPVARPAPSPS